MHPDHQRDFTEFVAGRSDSLIRLAYVLTNDRHAAEDLLQTALAKTAAHWRRIRANPEAYVRRVMYHEQVGRRPPASSLYSTAVLVAPAVIPGRSPGRAPR
ncbi:sigma factor [Streptosporangium jomthongense]|uniref:Sigma factor n=1 Tax=Streptosporangium jomthongense TaxID=1193683 RepID=A0ABV8FDY1_9ACTN